MHRKLYDQDKKYLADLQNLRDQIARREQEHQDEIGRINEANK